MQQSDTDTRLLLNLDIGMTFILPDEHHREQHAGDTVEIIDYTSVGDYNASVIWAYADPDTGEYLGLINSASLPDGGNTTVEVVE